jgi:DNA repair exonuclease SbcCD ATPase subunit
MVQSPSNKQQVPFEVWSGGESQRLRLAAQMGLSNLIRSTSGTTLNLEVWDEPSQFISAGGVEDLLDSLRNRATQEKRQVWVVDHRTLGYSDFDNIITVCKNLDGSYIK